MIRLPLINFSKGEIAEELLARFDVQAYGSAVRRARNVRVKKYGGLEKRMGMRFVAEAYDDTDPVRLASFQFSISTTGSAGQNYAFEWGQAYMRVAAGGGMVLNEELAITGMTSANPVKVGSVLHGYSAGDQIYVTGQVGDWSALNGRFFTVVESIDDDHYTIDFDGTGFSAWTTSTGGITRADPPEPDPTPPDVPDPVAPPDPPKVGGGGGHHNDGPIP